MASECLNIKRIIRANVKSRSWIADHRGQPATRYLSPLSLTLIVRSEVPLASVAPPMRALLVPMSAATLPAAASQKTGAPRAMATAAFGSSRIPSSATSTSAPPIASKAAIPNRAPTCTACPLSTPPVGATRVTTRNSSPLSDRSALRAPASSSPLYQMEAPMAETKRQPRESIARWCGFSGGPLPRPYPPRPRSRFCGARTAMIHSA